MLDAPGQPADLDSPICDASLLLFGKEEIRSSVDNEFGALGLALNDAESSLVSPSETRVELGYTLPVALACVPTDHFETHQKCLKSAMRRLQSAATVIPRRSNRDQLGNGYAERHVNDVLIVSRWNSEGDIRKPLGYTSRHVIS